MVDTNLTGLDKRLHRSLSTAQIVFMIVSAAAPLAAMVATVPLAFALGNGAGVPAMFVFAGLTLLCFSVGYGAVSRRIVNAGGFYTYISCGLGRPVAVGSGLIAVIAYNTATVGLLGGFSYFAHVIGVIHGVDIPWEVWSGIGVIAVGILGYRQIDVSAKVLSVFMVCEVIVLMVLNIAIIIRHGGSALPHTSFAPSTITGAGIGVSMMFAFISFIGFESAALYGEESRNPRRSVARATFIAVSLVAFFYAFTSWVAVGAVGPSNVREVATNHLGDMFFNLSDDYLNSAATTVMQVLLCTSLFAGWLALHNAANRYMFVLGRERVLPSWLDAVHPSGGAPHRASMVQTVISIAIAGSFAVAGLDPYTSLTTSMLGLGTVGIVVLQALASLSIIVFFRRRPGGHWWRTGLAPLLGFIGLTTATVLVLKNFDVMTGTTSVLINSLPWIVLIAGIGGVLYALWMRSARPARYAALARVDTRVVPDGVPEPLHEWTAAGSSQTTARG